MLAQKTLNNSNWYFALLHFGQQNKNKTLNIKLNIKHRYILTYNGQFTLSSIVMCTHSTTSDSTRQRYSIISACMLHTEGSLKLNMIQFIQAIMHE